MDCETKFGVCREGRENNGKVVWLSWLLYGSYIAKEWHNRLDWARQKGRTQGSLGHLKSHRDG